MEGKVQYKGRWVDIATLPGPKPPAVGSDIYVPSAWYLSHGADDFHGGLCQVVEVTLSTSAGEPTWFVEVHERPGHGYIWALLSEQQESLKAEYGDTRGYPDPDNDPESNRW